MIKYISIVLLIASPAALQAMGYVKSLFQGKPCLENNPEHTKFYQDLLEDIKKGQINSMKILVASHKTDGASSCVLEKIGKEETAKLYTLITNVITAASNESYFHPNNLKTARKAIEDAQTALQIIHLGAFSEVGTPEYTFAEKSLRKLESKLREAEQKKESKPQQLPSRS